MKNITQMQYRPLASLKKHPRNPRTIKDDSFKKLVKSIDENPDYFEARPIILSDRTGELVIIAGNQRYAAAKEIGIKDVPTVLIPALTEEKEKEIMIRDNVSNGDWDYDILANEWDAGDLNDWGLDVHDWDADATYENKELDLDSFEDLMELKLSFTKDQYFKVTEYLDSLGKESKEQALLSLVDNV